jgi:anti-sigma factor RsiW
LAAAFERERMNCREFTEFLHDYLLGGLVHAEFDRHLAECPSCVAYLDSYKKTMQLARDAFPSAEDAPPPSDAPEELIQAILRSRSRDK